MADQTVRCSCGFMFAAPADATEAVRCPSCHNSVPLAAFPDFGPPEASAERGQRAVQRARQHRLREADVLHSYDATRPTLPGCSILLGVVGLVLSGLGAFMVGGLSFRNGLDLGGDELSGLALVFLGVPLVTAATFGGLLTYEAFRLAWLVLGAVCLLAFVLSIFLWFLMPGAEVLLAVGLLFWVVFLPPWIYSKVWLIPEEFGWFDVARRRER